MPLPGRHPSPDGDSKDVRVGDARRFGWGGCLDGDLGEPSLHGGVHDNHRRGWRGQQQQQVRSPSTNTILETHRGKPLPIGVFILVVWVMKDFHLLSCSRLRNVTTKGKEPPNFFKKIDSNKPHTCLPRSIQYQCSVIKASHIYPPKSHGLNRSSVRNKAIGCYVSQSRIFWTIFDPSPLSIRS